MIYYYFTLAFVLLASWAICGIMSAYSPELLISGSYTVKSEALLRLLKIELDDSSKMQDSPDRYKVTRLGVVMRFLWFSFLIMSLIVLFAVEPTPITEEHSTALIMPAVLTTFNQKIAHYINLIFLCISSAVCTVNCCRILYKGYAGQSKKAVLIARILWCLLGTAIFAAGIYIAVKCIQLLSFI